MGVFALSALAILAALVIHAPSISVLFVWPQILVIAIVIAIIELISKGWQDNFLIPLFTAGLMWLLLYPGVPLIT